MTNVDSISASGSPFWQFSLRFYRRKGVPDACIAVQERAGVDVNLLLFLLWQASQCRAFTATEVKALDERIEPWRLATVIPLRTVRRALKEPPTLISGAIAEAYRNKIKAVELEAERLQQEAMYALAETHKGSRTVSSSEEAARLDIAAYQSMLGVTFPESAVTTLLSNFVSLNNGD
jgi:uncharacterized protein (TIGR02444 family)